MGFTDVSDPSGTTKESHRGPGLGCVESTPNDGILTSDILTSSVGRLSRTSHTSVGKVDEESVKLIFKLKIVGL